MRRMRRPIGEITRGTTAPNRLRRVDRWLVAAGASLLRSAPSSPLVVDLGYGAAPITTVEMFIRLRALRPDIQVMGVEIDPERVADARPYERPGLTFVPGGFELTLPRPPVVIRAFNVLRQYSETDAWLHWERLRTALSPEGLVVEGTCDEIGRRAVWVTLDPAGPRLLTLSARLASLDRPSDLAERLPKVLIHRNVPGQRINEFLTALDRAWERAERGYGLRHRWVTAIEAMVGDWPIHRRPPLGGRARWRLGELTLDWAAVAP